MSTSLLTPRWYPLKRHPTQLALASFPGRFAVVPAGRRSGKTERAKRHVVRRALRHAKPEAGRYFLAAPTRDQAKAIFWEDLKAMVPDWTLAERPSETELAVRLINGSMVQVIGMDKPERIEGRPWDGGVLDEYANMKAEAWGANVRPALSDRQGFCWLTGVPEGRNHYYELWKRALADRSGVWGAFTWHSADILPAAEVEQARLDLDELVFKQEYEGSFINFEGAAYYNWDERLHAAFSLPYDPRAPLNFCFDFNVEPGVSGVIQELRHPKLASRIVTGVIGEVHIPRSSTTELVCNKLIQDWGQHEGLVICYGDATGGARGSAKVAGSDWEIIMSKLRPVFGDRLHFKVPPANPQERQRVNAVNTRLKNANGQVHMLVDPVKAPNVVKDFEGVRVVKGGSGEIDKKADRKLTHMSDAVGYYVVHEHPITKQTVTSREYLV
jgi:hypothetical protein